MKILNLYAGIGGNRKLWPSEHEVTAVEIDPEIAAIYAHFFPQDRVVVGDAHKYLLEHFNEYDFIWSSPPCPTHSRIGFLGMKNYQKNGPVARAKKPSYPDMKLYQEIIFLHHFFNGSWVVENTHSYYEPLIKPFKSGSHFFWSNFNITRRKVKEARAVCVNDMGEKARRSGFDLSGFKLAKRKDQILNNCVDPKLGLHVLECAFKTRQEAILNY